MIKNNFVFSLSIILLLNVLLFVNVNTSAQHYDPINADIDRSGLPKNILIGSYAGGRSHLKPMLDIAAILIERGYNVKDFFIKLFPNFSELYHINLHFHSCH